MKYKRVRKQILEMLEARNMNTLEIYDELKLRHPKSMPTMHALTNILSKNKYVKVVFSHNQVNDTDTAYSVLGGRYKITVWGLK